MNDKIHVAESAKLLTQLTELIHNLSKAYADFVSVLCLLQVGPGVDVWAAGVMAYQLLSGAFPFNDWKNTRNPALSLVW